MLYAMELRKLIVHFTFHFAKNANPHFRNIIDKPPKKN